MVVCIFKNKKEEKGIKPTNYGTSPQPLHQPQNQTGKTCVHTAEEQTPPHGSYGATKKRGTQPKERAGSRPATEIGGYWGLARIAGRWEGGGAFLSAAAGQGQGAGPTAQETNKSAAWKSQSGVPISRSQQRPRENAPG